MTLALLVTFLIAQAAAGPQARAELAPGTTYDPAIPTLAAVVGHDIGDEISTPEEIAAYLRALAAAAPERTRLVEYARSWEGRPLHLLVIGAADRVGVLDQVKAGLRRLADPRGLPPAEADRLVKELPVVTWLMHAVHGDEITSCDAALAEAYHLLAARGDAGVEAILRESIVLIDPLQNPDGRARFLAASRQARAAVPDPEPYSAEQDQPWPGGRPNHYLFDMNRDWLAISQPETAGRIRIGLEWHPHVAADLHEMGGDSTYYFAPPADPANPHITPRQVEWLQRFGRENARRFDARGFGYFVREVFDSFYPGYGEAWPIFHGAIGMTFEQASPGGLAYRREDETVLTYRQGIVHHFTAAIATAETAARNREAILRDYLEYRRSAVQEGEQGAVREYLFPPAGDDRTRLDRLGRILVRHGIEVRRADEPVKLSSRTLPAGTLVVSLAQPASRLLRNLVDPTIRMDEKFIKEQERRRRKRIGDQIYDLTAWSLPLAFDIEIVTTDRPATAKSSPFVEPDPAARAAALPVAQVGYLLPWSSGAAALVAEALQQGLRVQTADEAFTLGGRKYAAGTAIVRVSGNPADLAERLGTMAARHAAEVVPTDTGWVEDGISLGSNRVVELKKPRVLLLWDVPASSSSAGWARFALERRFGQPVTAVRTASFDSAELQRFNVVVIPSGGYATALGEEVVKRLRDWVAAGGTLVTLGEASRWAAREKTGLLATRTELRDGRPEIDAPAEKKDQEPPKTFDLELAIQPDRERPEPLAGALARVQIDREHWLSAGLDEEIQVIVEGSRVFTPIKLDRGRNVGVYAGADRLLAGGFAWDSSKKLLPQKAFLMHQPIGRGHLVAFAEDPNYRAFAEATSLLFINAVLLGPGH